MKAVYRIAYGDQYEFIEVHECDDERADTAAIRARMDEIKQDFKQQPVNALSDKEFDEFIKNQLAGDGNHIEMLEKMSPAQARHYQINKRAIARLNYQLEKENE